jgi:hypothetical protein
MKIQTLARKAGVSVRFALTYLPFCGYERDPQEVPNKIAGELIKKLRFKFELLTPIPCSPPLESCGSIYASLRRSETCRGNYPRLYAPLTWHGTRKKRRTTFPEQPALFQPLI